MGSLSIPHIISENAEMSTTVMKLSGFAHTALFTREPASYFSMFGLKAFSHG